MVATKYSLCNIEKGKQCLGNVPCLNIASMEKVRFRSQWNIPLWFIAYIEKLWFYQRLFFKVVIVMIQIKKYIIIKPKLVLWIT